MIRSSFNSRRVAAGLAVGVLSIPNVAHACATCFGDPESLQTQGLNGAIITLLSITYGLFTLAAFGVLMLIRRYRNLPDNTDEHAKGEGEFTHG